MSYLLRAGLVITGISAIAFAVAVYVSGAASEGAKEHARHAAGLSGAPLSDDEIKFFSGDHAARARTEERKACEDQHGISYMADQVAGWSIICALLGIVLTGLGAGWRLARWCIAPHRSQQERKPK